MKEKNKINFTSGRVERKLNHQKKANNFPREARYEVFFSLYSLSISFLAAIVSPLTSFFNLQNKGKHREREIDRVTTCLIYISFALPKKQQQAPFTLLTLNTHTYRSVPLQTAEGGGLPACSPALSPHIPAAQTPPGHCQPTASLQHKIMTLRMVLVFTALLWDTATPRYEVTVCFVGSSG